MSVSLSKRSVNLSRSSELSCGLRFSMERAPPHTFRQPANMSDFLSELAIFWTKISSGVLWYRKFWFPRKFVLEVMSFCNLRCFIFRWSDGWWFMCSIIESYFAILLSKLAKQYQSSWISKEQLSSPRVFEVPEGFKTHRRNYQPLDNFVLPLTLGPQLRVDRLQMLQFLERLPATRNGFLWRLT